MTNAQGNQITLAYNAASRRIEETHIPAGGNEATRTITYTCDNAGNLTGCTDANAGHPDHQSHGIQYIYCLLKRAATDSSRNLQRAMTRCRR